MEANTKHIRHTIAARVKDESFSIDDLQSYNLYLNIGRESFEFCAVKNETNKCVLLEEYTFSNINNDSELEEELKAIWHNHHLLEAGFWKKVKVSFKNQVFNFIPKSLYNKSNNADYVQFTNVYDEKSENIGVYNHISFSGINVFTYPKNVYDFIAKQYPNLTLEITHQSSAIIESTFRGKFNNDTNRILLNVEQNHITITVIQKNELLYSNRFFYTSTEDFIYYIMLVYKEVGLDPEKDVLHIFGEIAPNSPLYEAIHKYIRYSNFGKRPKYLNFSYHFDEVFDHKFLSTYAIHLCE